MTRAIRALAGSLAALALGLGCSTSSGSSGSSGASSTDAGGLTDAGSTTTGADTTGAASGGSTGRSATSGSSKGAGTSGGSTGGGTSGGSTGHVTSGSSTGASHASSTGASTSGGKEDAGEPDGGFDPGQPGPYTVGTLLNLSETFAGQLVPLDLYYPTAPDGGPLDVGDGGVPEVVVSHGWLDSKSSFVGWGEHLASWGFAVAVPSWTNGMYYTSAPANAASIDAMLGWMDQGGPSDAGMPFEGLVDGQRHGLVGHSFGGLTVYLAASSPDAGVAIQVVVGLDPVDDPTGDAAAAVKSFMGMGVMIPAQSALCDSFGNDQTTVYANFPGQKLYAQVANAIHCDCQDPATSGCQSTCGPVDAIRQMHFKRYATAALLWAFSCDARARPWLDGAAIAADTGLSSEQSAAIACVPAP
ncbi:MAG TPA: hypothetical protein VMB50_17245 [Myxococcales bacterium]|nr:hypothetical protein [Myxococcales bacterium]